ncbi:MAG: hypothetical protein QNI87_11655 [Erythrobacter sp.]|uniref:hypothetical protein n=1 Tax=Erythrobacter sp. TaxID=1042 RepID=UPI00260BF38F|nr:hypothetical protein [Erythrobacter sp.]MDJ0979174.1 hypothetical protein [Erythrobacter sp.]
MAYSFEHRAHAFDQMAKVKRPKLKSKPMWVAWLALSVTWVGAPIQAQASDEAQPDGPPPSDGIQDELPAADEGVADEDVIIVRGRRMILSEIEPERELTEQDIAAFGASSLGDLASLLLQETSSGRGRSRDAPPVVLVNGRRVSGFREIGRYPVEALSRVQVYPEEVALSFGFSADQRVLNFILKPNVTVTAFEASGDTPQEGGSTTADTSGQFLYINNDTRLSIDASLGQRTAITEAERDIVFEGSNESAAFRTLSPSRDQWSSGFSAGTGIWGGAAATLSGSFERTDEQDLFGIDPAAPAEALEQDRRFDDASIGLTFTSKLAPTTWTLTSSYNILDVNVVTDLVNQDRRFASSQNRNFDTAFVVNSALADLAAGPLSLTAQTSVTNEVQEAQTDDISNEISRTVLAGGLSLDVPFYLPAPLPGEFSVNANLDVEDFSDFGTLTTYGYGLVWRPLAALRIIASITEEQGAPSLASVGDPIIVTPGVRVFDFATGEDRFIDVIDGGNPDLTVDDRSVFKLGVQVDPFPKKRVRFNTDYTRSRIKDETRSFLLLTEELEAAFPDRVLRDQNGALVAFDRRPLLVTESLREELRSGINWTIPLKSKRVRQEPGAKQRRSGRRGQMRITLNHTWTLNDEVLPIEGGERFDFLNGSASNGIGGVPEHIFDFSLYRWNNGLGFGARFNYQTATKVDAPEGRLTFSDRALLDLRVTYELNYADSVLEKAPFLEETRLSFGIRNLFADRIKVRDAFGEIPLSFQREALDPFGRVFEIELRRRF